MSRIGITKTYAAGTISTVDVIQSAIRQMIFDAGFNIIENTQNVLDFMPTGRTPSDTCDDIPHWAMVRAGDLQLRANAVYGASFLDANARNGSEQIILDVGAGVVYYDNLYQMHQTELTMYAAADGLEGWWWAAFFQKVQDNVSPTPLPFLNGMNRGVICTKSKRIAADMSQGECARYGAFDLGTNGYAPPYALKMNGAPQSGGVYFPFWSPVGGQYNGKQGRRVGSPLGRVMAPVWVYVPYGDISLSLFGELEDVYICSDGFGHLSLTDVPGWMFISTEDNTRHTALRAPTSFNVLP